MMAAYGISNNVLVKNNLMFGYKLNNAGDISLRIENKGYRKDSFVWSDFAHYFDQAKLDFVTNSQKGVRYGI